MPSKKKPVSKMTAEERKEYDRKVRKATAQKKLESASKRMGRKAASDRKAAKKEIKKNTSVFEAVKEITKNRKEMQPKTAKLRTEKGVKSHGLLKMNDYNWY